VEDRGKLSQILREGPIPDEVADNPEQFAKHYTDRLRARRHGNAGELLQRREVGKVVHHAAELIHAVGVWNIAVPRLPLTHLFCAAMVEADFRYAVDNLFAIKLQHDSQHAMRPWMLRPHIEKQEIAILARTLETPLLRPEAHRILLGVFPLFREA